MAVEVKEEQGGKILEVTATGQLTHEDYERFVPLIETRIGEYGSIRILFRMHDFHGWKPGALWDDLRFDTKHFRDIERLALVGDRAWEHGMAMFCKPFTTADIRYFDHSRLEEARSWLAA